jgi:hypothetical protein
MIHISKVTNNGSVHVCVSVYPLYLKRNSPARTCPSVKTVPVRTTKNPLYLTNPVYTTMYTCTSIPTRLRLWTPLVSLNVTTSSSDRYWMKWLKKYTRIQIWRNKGKNHEERLWSSVCGQTVKTRESSQNLFRILRNHMSVTYVWM